MHGSAVLRGGSVHGGSGEPHPGARRPERHPGVAAAVQAKALAAGADPSLPDAFGRLPEELAAIAAHSAKHRFGTPFEEGVQEALGEWLGLNMARLQASKHNGGLAVQLTEEALGRLAERAAAGIEAGGIQVALQHESLRLGLCDFGVAPSGELRRCKLLGKGDQQHPQSFVCPVTLELLHDPVTTPYGHTYERSALFEHLQHWQSDPLTKQPLTLEQVFPNFALRQALDEYRSTLSKEAHGGA